MHSQHCLRCRMALATWLLLPPSAAALPWRLPKHLSLPNPKAVSFSWSSLASDTVWSIDHQPTFLEMSPLVSMVSSIVTSSSHTSRFWGFFFTAFSSSLNTVEDPCPQSLDGYIFSINIVASTQMVCQSLILTPTPIPGFGHWLPTANETLSLKSHSTSKSVPET